MRPVTLPDYLSFGVRILSIGLNPSLPSVRAGVYFANPRNRFWTALVRAGFDSVGEGGTIRPSVKQLAQLTHQGAMGFTDVVKRPTKGGADLVAEDFRRWTPILRAKVLLYRPKIAWFHGRVACTQFYRFGPAQGERAAREARGAVVWGRQAWCIGSVPVFVSPNPSSANAAFSLDALAQSYREMLELVRELEG